MSTGLIPAVDQVVEYFNRRKLDLPDGFFDRKAQFVINGAPFETLLSNSPGDPLVLMLSRGPAGYRFTVKALQHAIPNAKVERGDVVAAADPSKVSVRLWLSGTLRGSAESIHSLVSVTLSLTDAGAVGVAEGTIPPDDLEKIRKARLSA